MLRFFSVITELMMTCSCTCLPCDQWSFSNIGCGVKISEEMKQSDERSWSSE